MSLDDERIRKLNVLAKKYLHFQNMEDLSYKEIRRLQYLVKTHRSAEKTKLFGLINIYRNTKDIFLRAFCRELLEKLEKKYN